MALVAYDFDSSEGEGEEEEADNSSVIVFDDKDSKGEGAPETLISKMLSDLPKTKPSSETAKITIDDDPIEDFIPKYLPSEPKEKQKVKIMIPSLSQFKEDESDEPKSKKAKAAAKGSGLLSILPPVKSTPLTTKSFIPNVLKSKTKPNTKSTSSLVPHNVRKRAELAKKAAIQKITKSHTNPGSDLESDDDIEVPTTFDDEMWNKVCGRSKPKKEKPKTVTTAPADYESYYSSEQFSVNSAPEPEKPYEGLDQTAFKQLVGKGKPPLNIKLVDVNEEEILPEKEIWMTKALTDPDCVPKPSVEEPVDPTRRKKHHITYLAEQAKANEQELQGQWSANKYTRNQTRAKYGF